MKINQVLNEGFWGDMKSSFNQGRKDYIAKRAGELGINTPAPTTSVPITTPKTAAAAPKIPAKKTLNAFIKEIDGLKKHQQVKIYNYLQDKLF